MSDVEVRVHPRDNGRERNKREKRAVIASANALIEPWAMMIEVIHASIALAAVLRPAL